MSKYSWNASYDRTQRTMATNSLYLFKRQQTTQKKKRISMNHCINNDLNDRGNYVVFKEQHIKKICEKYKHIH